MTNIESRTIKPPESWKIDCHISQHPLLQAYEINPNCPAHVIEPNRLILIRNTLIHTQVRRLSRLSAKYGNADILPIVYEHDNPNEPWVVGLLMVNDLSLTPKQLEHQLHIAEQTNNPTRAKMLRTAIHLLPHTNKRKLMTDR